jgi:hypothetical protein
MLNRPPPGSSPANPQEVQARRGIDALTASWLDADVSFPRSPLAEGLDRLAQTVLVRITRLARFWEREATPPLEGVTRDLVTGLHGPGRTWLFALRGRPTEIQCWYGLRAEPGTDASSVRSLLAGSFPDLRTNDGPVPGGGFRLGARLTGLPGLAAAEKPAAPAERIERLCRGLYGSDWLYATIARPVPREGIVAALTALDLQISAASRLPRELPVAGRLGPVERYLALLDQQRQRLEQARAQGLWDLRVWLLANDPAVLARGRSFLHSAFAGPDPVVQPLRTHRADDRERGEPRDPSTDQPFEQLLTSAEAAALTCPPREEYPGYQLVPYTRFGVSPSTGGRSSPREAATAGRSPDRKPADQPIPIGDILDRGTRTGNCLTITTNDLTKHGLVVGVTGSGKTNTCFELLAQLAARGVPFLVIESAKSEYRSLLRDRRFVPPPQVYTVGDETATPLRLNPFEVPAGILVQTHIDYLKALFAAAFVLYPPMPYVLEQSIQEIYQDRGWDLAANQNWRQRLDDYRGPRLFPTLDDLVDKVRAVVERLGYHEQVKLDVTAGLVARLDQLRGGGGKGPMLNTRAVLGTALFEQPAILELKQMVSDDEKAFLMGLLLLRLYEYHEARASSAAGGTALASSLRHVTLIEEAHRLLRNVSTEQGSDVSANPKGRAIEVFANLLSEIRAYGEGILIAEQVPVKLTPDAIKNTNLKIVHRLLAEDDRLAVGNTMNLSKEQTQFLTTLSPGEAVAYTEQLPQPVLLQVALSPLKDAARAEALPAARVAPPGDVRGRGVSRPGAPALAETARQLFNALRLAPPDPALVLQIYGELQRMAQRAQLGRGPQAGVQDFARLVDAEVERRGEQAGWPYSVVEGLVTEATRLVEQVAAAWAEEQPVLPSALEAAITRYADAAARTHAIPPDEQPFAGCDYCDRPCQFRYDMRGEPNRSRAAEFQRGLLDHQGAERVDRLAEVALVAAQERFPWLDPTIQAAAAFCFAVQQLGEPGLSPTWQAAFADQIKGRLALDSELEALGP